MCSIDIISIIGMIIFKAPTGQNRGKKRKKQSETDFFGGQEYSKIFFLKNDPETYYLLFLGPNVLKNYVFANSGATNEYTSTWQKQIPYFSAKKNDERRGKTALDGPKRIFCYFLGQTY